MKKIIFFSTIFFLFFSLIFAGKPEQKKWDSNNTSVLNQANLANLKTRDIVFISTKVKIEESFCFIITNDSVFCLSNILDAFTPGVVTKIIGKRNNIKTIVVSFPKNDYVYKLYFSKTKNTSGLEEFVLNEKVDLLLSGKTYKVPVSTESLCYLLIKK